MTLQSDVLLFPYRREAEPWCILGTDVFAFISNLFVNHRASASLDCRLQLQIRFLIASNAFSIASPVAVAGVS